MLEKIDLNKKMSKQEYSESLPKIEAELGRLQRECKDLDIPVMIIFEGSEHPERTSDRKVDPQYGSAGI